MLPTGGTRREQESMLFRPLQFLMRILCTPMRFHANSSAPAWVNFA
jgi:hypothetical protein